MFDRNAERGDYGRGCGDLTGAFGGLGDEVVEASPIRWLEPQRECDDLGGQFAAARHAACGGEVVLSCVRSRWQGWWPSGFTTNGLN